MLTLREEQSVVALCEQILRFCECVLIAHALTSSSKYNLETKAATFLKYNATNLLPIRMPDVIGEKASLELGLDA